MWLSMKTYAEKRFFEWHEDDVSVTLRNKSGSYGGGQKFSWYAVDFYSLTVTGDVTMTLTAARMDDHHIPCVVIEDDVFDT